MSISCVPAYAAEQLKEAVKNKQIDIAKLYQMTSQDRQAVFSKYTNNEVGQFVNGKFEKAMISKQKDALQKWAQSTFTPQMKKSGAQKNLIQKIKDLDVILNPNTSKDFLSGLVAESLGVSVTEQEAKTISQKAKNLEALFQKQTPEGPTDEYYEARNDMDKYLSSLAPTSNLKVFTSTVGRGAMLASVKSPVLNIESNTIQAVLTAIERRVESGKARGLNDKYAGELVKRINGIYQKSGFDISRMEGFSEGQKRLGEDITHSQGKGPIRAVGRIFEDVVFKQLMGAPDVLFASVAFTDSLNLNSTEMVKSEGLEGKAAQSMALKMMQDAANPEPKTIEGQVLRAKAMADAQYATYTNSSWASELGIGIRNVLNDVTGDVQLGTTLMPFIKTPANLVAAGLDYSLLSSPFWISKVPSAIQEFKSGNFEPMRGVAKSATRAGLGMILATILSFAFDPEDFVGEYDLLSQKERELGQAKNAPYNSIKIGDQYVSTDYFGPLATPFVAMMYARKYGDSLPEGIWEYVKGAGAQISKTPGLAELSELVKDTKDRMQRGDFAQAAQGYTDDFIGFIRSRTIPAIVNDLAIGTDEFQRQTGRDAISKAKAGIPGLRQTLPEKIDQLTGKEKEGEGFIKQLLFGSRVKTAEESPLTDEISRLFKNEAGPTLSNIQWASTRMKEFKEQVSDDKFQSSLKYYGKNYGQKATALIRSASYRSKSDDEKKDEINSVRREVLEDTLKKFGYRKPSKKK